MSQASSEDNPILQTSHGKIRGQKLETVYGDAYYSFSAVPYAEPPLGKLRFQAPQQITRWQGIKDCTQVAAKAVQWNRYAGEVQGAEDCLYLNVYAKKLKPKMRLPVMVYVHGGGFNTGDATHLSWGPDYFMMKDVVFITIGYRLGIFGLASFADPSVQIPGNAALMDVIMALKWIKENCEIFNGDSDNITLFGHSSGSWTTHLLMLAPSARDLFHKSIVMAGYALDISFVPKLEYRLAKHLGYQGTNVDKDVCEFLQNAPAEKLVGFDILTDDEKSQYVAMYPFFPTMETYRSDNGVVVDDPIELQRKSWSNRIPMMTGTCSNEAVISHKMFSTNEQLYKNYRDYPERMLAQKLQFIKDKDLKLKLANKLKKLHHGEKKVCMENLDQMIEHHSYNIYHQQHRLLQARIKYAQAPTYLYRFDFDSPTFNLYRIKHCGTAVRGAGHVDELSYIFYMPGSYKLDKNTPEYKCILTMIDSWYSFAKGSDPTTARLQPAYWEPIQRIDGIAPKCLNISYESVDFIDWPEYEKCCARDDLFKEAKVTLF